MLQYTGNVQGMTLNCIHIFIVTGSFLYWCVMRPASQRFFIRSCIYLRILIISYLATFFDTNSLSVLMCCRAVDRSIDQYMGKLVISSQFLCHQRTSVTTTKLIIHTYIRSTVINYLIFKKESFIILLQVYITIDAVGGLLTWRQ